MNETIMFTMLRSLISLLPIDPDATAKMIEDAYLRVVTWDDRLKEIERQLRLIESKSDDVHGKLDEVISQCTSPQN